MKKWTQLDKAETPDGKTLSLHEQDGRYCIRVNGAELMSTRQHASEEKLAELACAHLKGSRTARVLVGGLGFGFTLRAVLGCVSERANVVVAEIMAAVIQWNKNPEFNLASAPMRDPRVEIVQEDVAEIIRGDRTGFDAIILDVDNGPAALTADSNERLYEAAGLLKAYRALRPGGCLAVWSAGANPSFANEMKRAGFTVDVQRSRAHTTSGGWHTLFIGKKSATKF